MAEGSLALSVDDKLGSVQLFTCYSNHIWLNIFRTEFQPLLISNTDDVGCERKLTQLMLLGNFLTEKTKCLLR